MKKAFLTKGRLVLNLMTAFANNQNILHKTQMTETKQFSNYFELRHTKLHP